MRRRDFLVTVASTIASISLAGCGRQRSARRPGPSTLDPPAPGRRPNIVVIIADDLGYADLGCYGGRDIPTPNIDSLAANGARFTNGYVTAPVCSPTRAGLMTGRYQQRFGHEFNPGSTPEENFGLPLDQVTLPQILREHGYRTGMVGKWHLGLRPKYRPTERGFDEFFGFLGGAHAYLNLDRPGTAPILRGTTPVEEDEYLTDAFAREAVAFVERHHERPFFLYLPFNAIHTPLQATEKYLARFDHIPDEKRRTMAAMLSAMDDAVGRVLDALRKHQIEDDTLIFFISDNGGPTQANTSRNDPLSGFKGQLLEGGIRVPYMIQWKERVNAGGVIDWPVNSLDVFATALAAAGATTPPRDRASDGIDLVRHVQHRSPPPRDALYWRFGEPRAIRMGNHKLLMLPGERPMLFDLSNDPGEKHDLAATHPEKVKELRDAYEKWDDRMIAPKWGRTRPRRRRRQRDRMPTTTQGAR